MSTTIATAAAIVLAIVPGIRRQCLWLPPQMSLRSATVAIVPGCRRHCSRPPPPLHSAVAAIVLRSRRQTKVPSCRPQTPDLRLRSSASNTQPPALRPAPSGALEKCAHAVNMTVQEGDRLRSCAAEQLQLEQRPLDFLGFGQKCQLFRSYGL